MAQINADSNNGKGGDKGRFVETRGGVNLFIDSTSAQDPELVRKLRAVFHWCRNPEDRASARTESVRRTCDDLFERINENGHEARDAIVGFPYEPVDQ